MVSSDSARFVENTLYFPGWKVIVDGKEVPVQFQDAHYRGLMTFDVKKGIHYITVVYKESRMRLIGDVLSILGLLGVGLLLILGRKRL
jgi:uncharacterized membrane protein YfhO